MRELVVNTFLSLDGVMQGPGGPEEDPTGAFTLGGWSAGYWDERMGQRMDVLLKRPFDLLLGRRTYEIFASHWPHAEELDANDVAAKALNGAKKLVASRTLQRVDWRNSTLLAGDVPTDIAALKKQDGPEIQVHGSANLLKTLIAHNLVDRYQLWIFPVVIGTGKRLFENGTVPAGLKLVDSDSFSTGVIVATYEPAGAIAAGSFEFHEPTPAELERRKKLAAES